MHEENKNAESMCSRVHIEAETKLERLFRRYVAQFYLHLFVFQTFSNLRLKFMIN